MTDTSEIAIDRARASGSATPSPPETPEAEMMRDELRSVIASPDFARAPIMKRLLSFLVGETAAGRGDQLKAYSVAVDGLGRAPDYDARADSYPRVQVGRLRRMLDSYYSTTAPAGGLRLTIPSGRYKVALKSTQIEAEQAIGTPPARVLPERPLTFTWQLALIFLAVVAATVAITRFVPIQIGTSHAGRERPLVDLAAVTMARQSELGNLIRASLLDGLNRSNMFDLRVVRPTGSLDPKPQMANYRLGADLINGDRPRLFLRLSSISPERLIWSGDISLPGKDGVDDKGLEHVLAPVFATLGQVNGVIATHQLQKNSGHQAIGYTCKLLYYHYRRERTDRELEDVQTCVKRSLDINPNHSGLQAAAAQLAIEKMVSSGIDQRERSTLLLTARRHAQISASIDPLDPWGNIAQARIALIRQACPQSISFALRAAQLQPYDPTLLADAGVYLLGCGDPRAETMFRRAIALDGNPEGRFYQPLLLLAVSRDDWRLAREALAHMAPPALGRHGHFYLTSASAYAMIGDIPRARAAWTQLAASNPAIAGDPQGFLERLGYSEQLRAKAIGHLREARLIR